MRRAAFALLAATLAAPRVRAEGAVPGAHVEAQFQKPDWSDWKWTLHDAHGRLVCELPCAHSAEPGDGFFVRADDGEGHGRRYELTDDLGAPVGPRRFAHYVPRTGSRSGPLVLGAISGTFVVVSGIVQTAFAVVSARAGSPCHAPCTDNTVTGGSETALGVVGGVFGLSLTGVAAALFWNATNREAHFVFDARPESIPPSGAREPLRLRISLSPGGLVGSF